MLYYLSQYLLAWSAGTEWADRLSALRLFQVHHLPQRRGGGDRAGPELVAGAEGDRLA